MTYRHSTRTGGRRTRSTFLAALVVTAVLTGVLASRLVIAHGDSDALPFPHPPGVGIDFGQQVAEDPVRRAGHDRRVRRDHARPPLGAAGRVRDGQTVFDNETAAVANLDPDLLHALRRAATDAAGVGVEFYVNSGWRSAEYQAELLRDAISEYGSEAGASRWVATPETSAHVSGDAVDIGQSDATAWLSEHGSEYGLCQIYENEPWHYELRPDALDHGCPPMYANPTHDPRMQQ